MNMPACFSKETSDKIYKLRSYGPFTLAEAKKRGLSQSSIFRLLEHGIFVRLGSGIYQVADSEFDPTTTDFVVSCLRFGKYAVIGGLSALSYYQLIDQVPSQIWVLVPPTKRTTDKQFRLLRTKHSLKIEIINENRYCIVTLERALVEGLIFSSKIGEETAVKAIIRAIKEKKTYPEKLFSVAKKLKSLNRLDKYWQGIKAGVSS